MDAREIEALIKAALPDAKVEIRDLAGDGDHYAAEVDFGGFPAARAACSSTRWSMRRCKGRMGGELHALALQTAPRN